MLEPLDKDVFMKQLEKSEELDGHSASAIRRFYNWMYSDGEGAVQVCAFPVPTEEQDNSDVGPGKWIHARGEQEFVEFCELHSDLWRYHVYSGINTLEVVPANGRGKVEHIDTVNHVSFDIETRKESYQGANKQEVWWSYLYALSQVKFLADEYGVWPLIVMSENGIHLHYKADFRVADRLLEGKQHILSKYITSQAQNSKYAKHIRDQAPSHIDFDQDDVSDIPRVMKVAGTKGIKSESGRMCGIIHEPDLEDAGILTIHDLPDLEEIEEYVEESSIETKNSTTRGTASLASFDDELKHRIKKLCKNDSVFAQYWQGDTGWYKSRSEAEYAFILKLLNHGFTEREIMRVMRESGMTKWDEEGENYQRRTLNNAKDDFDGKVTKDSLNGSNSFSLSSTSRNNESFYVDKGHSDDLDLD